MAQDINRFVFFPVKEQLEQIHQSPGEKADAAKEIGVVTPRHSERVGVAERGKPSSAEAAEGEEENGYIEEPSEERQEQREDSGRGPDTYREPIE